jgi:hypothetical protein
VSRRPGEQDLPFDKRSTRRPSRRCPVPKGAAIGRRTRSQRVPWQPEDRIMAEAEVEEPVGREVRFEYSRDFPRILDHLHASCRSPATAASPSARAGRSSSCTPSRRWPRHRALRRLRRLLAGSHSDRHRQHPRPRAGLGHRRPLGRQHPVLRPLHPRRGLQLRPALAAPLRPRARRPGPLPPQRPGPRRRPAPNTSRLARSLPEAARRVPSCRRSPTPRSCTCWRRPTWSWTRSRSAGAIPATRPWPWARRW